MLYFSLCFYVVCQNEATICTETFFYQFWKGWMPCNGTAKLDSHHKHSHFSGTSTPLITRVQEIVLTMLTFVI